MKGDFTRIPAERARRYAAVLMQQGRVQLDADWNEQVAIRDRLEQLAATDLIGPAGAPEVGGGFAVGISADGQDLTLSAGRMYVEGLLCELEEEATYTTQPYLPVPEALTEGDTGVDGRTDLVYLDVWQRHVTAVEDPELLDPALNGLDTTTRLQTVWQVRVLKGVGDVTCDAVAGFPPTASGAQLTSDAVATPDEADPCEVVAAGGYRGVENRLYRVEIHNPGDMGAATWKWSRDNGAVLFAVEEFIAAPADQLRLRSLGRDLVLTLRPKDWVEILDDASELGFAPGFMARVEEVNPATRIVRLDRDLPAGTFAVARNARVRRWDQVLDVDADGLLTTGTGPFDLEDGVQVRLAGGDYRSGDHWSFAARTAGGTLDQLTDAPPQGIRHHYAPLALIRWADAGDGSFTATVVEDCRATFPPLTGICADDVCYDNTVCDLAAGTVQEAIEALCQRESPATRGGLCTVTLGVDGVDDLQQAVDQLPVEQGGCICIPAGVFLQREPVFLRGRKSITIEGCGPASAIEYEGTDLPLFTLERSSDILLHRFAMRCSSGGVATLRGGSRIRTVDCTIECRQGIAFEALRDIDHLTVEGCFVSARRALVFGEGSSLNGVFVRGNFLQASEQVVQSVQRVDDRLVHVRIEGNTIEGSGVLLESLPVGADVTIAGNRISQRDKPAVQLMTMGDRALLTVTENQIGTLDDPAGQGVVVEKQMAPEAMLVLQGNRVVTVREAIVVRSSEGSGELHVNANVLRSLESIPVVSIGGNIGEEPGIAHVLFNNNQVYTDRLPEDRCTVQLNAARLVVMGNYVADRREGDPRRTSICLPREAQAATAIGNVSRNGVNLEGLLTPPRMIVINNAVF
ncbi:MAG: DUF6519 domain-containing protein [Longimicrobiaceae bacterium]